VCLDHVNDCLKPAAAHALDKILMLGAMKTEWQFKFPYTFSQCEIKYKVSQGNREIRRNIE